LTSVDIVSGDGQIRSPVPMSWGWLLSSQTRLRRLKRRATTTPGLLAAVAAGLVALGLVSGLVGLLTVQRRSALVRDVGAHSGPLTRLGPTPAPPPAKYQD
jgi:hypothetical protein